MNTDDLPSGPKPIRPAPVLRFSASRREDLGPFLERMKDQEFRFADISHRPEEKAVDVLFERVHPPDKGTWALRIGAVRSWQSEHQANHETDTFKDLAVTEEDQGRKVVIRCVLDRFTAVVDRVDLRLARLGAEPPAKVQYRDLPEWFRAEIQERHNEAQREEERKEGASRSVRLRVAAGGAILPLLIGAATGGRWLLLVPLCLLVGGGVAWFMAGSNSGRFLKGILYGLSATAACFAAGGWQGLFFTPLLLLCGGIFLMIWAEQLRDMEV